MPTQKELLAAHRRSLDAEWQRKWPDGQWTFIHGNSPDDAWVIALQARRSTSHVRYRAQHAIGHKYPDPFYPSRWYGPSCRVEHFTSQEDLLARLAQFGMPVETTVAVRGWSHEKETP